MSLSVLIKMNGEKKQMRVNGGFVFYRVWIAILAYQ
jgi:hypothetical protein